MSVISISRPITQEQTDIYEAPAGTPVDLTSILLVALEKSTITVYRYQALDETLYELIPPTVLEKNGTLETLDRYLLPGDKIVAVADRSRAIIHINGRSLG